MPVDLSEQVLVDQLVAGDHAALGELYNRYYKVTFCGCFRILRHREDAEDATQDVFLRIRDKISNFDGRSALSTWLYRLAGRVALNKLRTQRENEVSIEDLVDHPAAPEFDPIPKIAMDKALQEIPRRDRLFWRRRFVEGLDPFQIAAESGVTVATVKNALYTTRQRLRQLLEVDKAA